MRQYCCLFAVLVSLFTINAHAQHAANASARYFRVIALVPLTGTGIHDDPIRPEYAPISAGSSSTLSSSRSGILGWTFQITDDGKMAIVQFVAANHHAFDALLNDKRPNVRVIEAGSQSPTAIASTMQAF